MQPVEISPAPAVTAPSCSPQPDDLACPNCGQHMLPEHAHHKCPECGYIQPCCGW
jgi:Zn finger protein HypA/HybF involved in hydrogenase expression